MNENLYRIGANDAAPVVRPSSGQQHYYANESPFGNARDGGGGDRMTGRVYENAYAGQLPHLYGNDSGSRARPWSAGAHMVDGSRTAGLPRPPPAAGTAGAFFTRRYDTMLRRNPYYGGDRPAPHAPLYDLPSERPPQQQQQPLFDTAAGVSPISAGWRQDAPAPASLSSGGGYFGGAEREQDLVSTPTASASAGHAATPPLRQAPPSERRPSPPRLSEPLEQHREVVDSDAAAAVVADEPESQVLERVVAQQTELVESIRERLRGVQRKKQLMQEQLAKIREQEQAEMRAAAEVRGRLEEERSQYQEQLVQLQDQLESLRAQRDGLARDYAARDAERRVAAERAAEEKAEVTRIKRRLEELQRDMQERLAAEEGRYRARVESAKAAGAQAERNAKSLMEVEGRLASAAGMGPGGDSASRA